MGATSGLCGHPLAADFVWGGADVPYVQLPPEAKPKRRPIQREYRPAVYRRGRAEKLAGRCRCCRHRSSITVQPRMGRSRPTTNPQCRHGRLPIGALHTQLRKQNAHAQRVLRAVEARKPVGPIGDDGP